MTSKKAAAFAKRALQEFRDRQSNLPLSALPVEFRKPSEAMIAHRTELLRERDFDGYLGTFDGHKRLAQLLALLELIDDRSYWRAVRFVWDKIEISAPDSEVWLGLFTSNRPKRDFLTTTNERNILASLPDELTLYRGYAKGKSRRGLSWTLSKERACFFAEYAVGGRRAMLCGHRRGGPGMVVIGMAEKRDVLAYFHERGEQEIVIAATKVSLRRFYQHR